MAFAHHPSVTSARPRPRFSSSGRTRARRSCAREDSQRRGGETPTTTSTTRTSSSSCCWWQRLVNTQWVQEQPLTLGSTLGAALLSLYLGMHSSPALAVASEASPPLDLDRYSGTWFEVASLKEGFAGEGQKDCHCTAGLYTMNDEQRLSVKTFCVHGSPTGKISGIEGRVTCLSDQTTKTTSPSSPSTSSSAANSEEYEQCKLNFPSIPFIPPEPYTVLETDYDSFALVEGAKDKSFVQVYSRTPNPGKAFINGQIQHLERDYGYKKNAIKPTPQDCSQQLMTKMDGMMKSPGMASMFQNTTENTIDELLRKEEEQLDGIALQGPRNPIKEAKDLVNLFQMFAQ